MLACKLTGGTLEFGMSNAEKVTSGFTLMSLGGLLMGAPQSALHAHCTRPCSFGCT